MWRKLLKFAIVFLLLTISISIGLAGYIYSLTQTDSTAKEVAAGKNSVWCNNRYLPSLDAQQEVFDSQHLRLAKDGYLYALLGAYVLQKDNNEGKKHQFLLPARVIKNNALHQQDDASGFEGNTFEIYSSADLTERTEVVITFTGSNDKEDWKANFSINRSQYNQAVNYVKKVAASYPDTRFTVTGYSLGGALSTHVTKNPETAKLITKTWVFNPSPKTWSDASENPKIWQAATEHDILKVIRLPYFQFLPGVSAIGAPLNQTAEHFYLIDSNPVFAHYRWALARNILHVADLALYKESGGTLETTEPLTILQQSNFHACDN